jgi:glycosyltransferase involved in cell wall biosynthesis
MALKIGPSGVDVAAGAAASDKVSTIDLQGLRVLPTPRTELSVIVPAFRDGEHIGPNLQRLSRALDSTGLVWEVIVIVDGDADTYRHAHAFASEKVQVHGYQANRGKGFALRYGMTMARGGLITVLDSDMDIAPEEIGRMVRLLRLYEADVVVGSKRHPLSRVHYPLSRRIQSACYQLLVRVLFRVNVRDTQTGLKVMRREVARRVLRVALVRRFAFDLELLALARRFGFSRIIEAPVEIDYHFASTTNLRAVFRVLWDTAAVFYRLRIRRWYDRHDAPGLAAMKAALPSRILLEERTDAMAVAESA